MKKILSLLAILSLSNCAPAPITPPVGATINDDRDRRACVMHLECEKGIEPIDSWRDLGNDFRPWSVELRKTFSLMNKLGIKPHIADKKYFDENTRGSYNYVSNKFFINKRYLNSPKIVLYTIRHEGWHAVQDCMGGTLYNPKYKLALDKDIEIPDWIVEDAKNNYDKKEVPYEVEAIYASTSSRRTIEGLKSCLIKLKKD
jgi:hypothetical protein